MSRDGIFLQGFGAPFGKVGYVNRAAGAGQDLEVFAPYAFDLAGGRIDLRCMHDGPVFASTSDRTLRVDQNDHGLRFEAALPERGDIWAWMDDMRRGRLGASVSMVDLVEGRNFSRTRDSAGHPLNRVHSASLDHIAIAHWPAYPDTSVWLSTWDPYDMPPQLRAQALAWTEAPSRPVVQLGRPAASKKPLSATWSGTVDEHCAVIKQLAEANTAAARVALENHYRVHNGNPNLEAAHQAVMAELDRQAQARPR